MKHHRNMIETKRLNRKFVCDPKSVYRSMKGNTIEVKDMPNKMIFKPSGKVFGM